MSEVEKSLGNLAEEINAEHRACDDALRSGLQHAVNAGGLLTEAKERVNHGEWGSWLADNFEGSARTAQAYMKVSRGVPALGAAKAQRVAGLSFRGALAELSAPLEAAANHRALGTGENEWYTPPDVLEDVRALLGGIELDPASSEVAQDYVKAGRFFSQEDNALTQRWDAKTVFLNPPYAQPAIALFAEKMVDEYRLGHTREAILLTHNYTDTEWFHVAESAAAAVCFTRGRIKFVSPDGEFAAPTQGQAFFYFGDRPGEFAEAFAHRGFVR